MTDSRVAGRYNLHRLGWSAFEDLCLQIMRVVLGETCTRFRAGSDRGRDGYFRGVVAGSLGFQSALSGAFVIQCKHTSSSRASLDVSILQKEFDKIRDIAARDPCNYIVMTNRQVSAPTESGIRERIEAIAGVQRCLILGETWIEDVIDAHPRLLRLVPRLYGIGDLSQIVAFVIQEQTRAMLEDFAVELRTFVPTDSYRCAEKALYEHRLVVLVGPPASGKSAIAANLCMVSVAQDSKCRVLRIEKADQFTSTWSPSDASTVYWVDDVFGETTLDQVRLMEWAAALDKVEAARRRGARVILCTRDYILAAAIRKLKRSKSDMLIDARVVVNVTELASDEKEAILYNHVKHGDIGVTKKKQLKRHLPKLAGLPSFSPELARRLGSMRFHEKLSYEEWGLVRFFDDPVQHFRDVIHGLSAAEMAALSACLHSGNALVDPVHDGSVASAVLSCFGVSIQAVRDALEALEGSLVKRVRQATSQMWQLHHPSMIEALQVELAARSSQLVLYLQSAALHVILRDTTTIVPVQGSRAVFIPDSTYEHVLPRFLAAEERDMEGVAAFLTERASAEFLSALDRASPGLLDSALALVPEPEGSERAAELAVRIHQDGHMSGRRVSILEQALREAFGAYGWCGFLDVDGLPDVVPGLEWSVLSVDCADDFASLRRLCDWYAADMSATELVESAMTAVAAHHARVAAALTRCGLFSTEVSRQLDAAKERVDAWLVEKRSEVEEREEQRADYMQDEWKERFYFERHEMENGRFSDVDE